MRISRRRFLSNAGRLTTAGAIAGATLPLHLAHGGGIGAANDTVICGLIGVGGRGSFLMQRLINNGGVAIKAVCDVNQRHVARAQEAVKSAQGHQPAGYGDFRRLLDDRSLDAVVIATPHHWHTPIAVRALEAGKHIYVEKPASHVLTEGRRLVEASRRAKRIVQHGTQMRSSEVTAEAAKVLKSGILGEIKMSKAWGVEPRSHHPQVVADSNPPEGLDYNFWLGPAPDRPFNELRFRRWNSFRDYGNGEIGGDGIHDIDMARWGLGVTTHPVRVTAHGSRIHLKGESDFPDNMIVAYQYAEDKVLVYENRNFAPYKMHGWDNGNVFYGTQGYMIFSRRGYFQTYLGAKEKEGPGMRGGDGVPQHIANFVDCVRSGQQPHADAEVAHLSCAIVHLGEIAYRTGRVLHFDPQTEKFTGDEEANTMSTKEYRSPWRFS